MIVLLRYLYEYIGGRLLASWEVMRPPLAPKQSSRNDIMRLGMQEYSGNYLPGYKRRLD